MFPNYVINVKNVNMEIFPAKIKVIVLLIVKMHAFLKTGKTSSNIEKIPSGSLEIVQPEKKRPPQPWVEKYRPKSVDDVVEQDEVVQVFRQCLEGGDLPNMLLYGMPGTGKTSTILAASRQLFGDLFKDRVLELNASDERGISVVRQKVKNFALQTANSVRADGKPCPPFKIIILDEADAMTNAAQSALRRTMEKESRTTRFCLICNYVSRIIAPITSRCTKFRFKPLGHNKVVERLQLICEKEDVQIDDDALDCIVDISGGDMRRAITTLQSAYRLNGANIKLTKPVILDISGVIPLEYLEKFFTVCKSGVYVELVDFIKEMTCEAYTFGQLLDQLNEFLITNSELTNTQKSLICDKLGECSYKLHDGASEYLQVMDLACVIIMIFLKQ